MAEAYIALGSNMGDKESWLRFGIDMLEGAGAVKRVSNFYVTTPVGFVEQEDFLNAAAMVETSMTPAALLQYLLEIEQMAGRERTVKNGPRTLDLDILFYDSLVVEEPGLTIPHPRLHERMFVLLPLSGIAPDLVHPVLGKTVAQMKADLVS